MANTVTGPYTKTTWVDHVTLGSQSVMNNLETAAAVGVYSLNPDLSGPFVLSGVTCTKDGTTANQLDIASGTAYLTATDGTIIRIAVGADNTHTTSTPSTTYYLFLKNDGTWQWSTTSTGPTNSLAICQATTDGSGNILVVTDKRSSAVDAVAAVGVVHQVNGYSLTVTTDTIVATYTPPVDGWYRVSMHVLYSNSVSQKPAANVNFYAPEAGGYAVNFMRSAQDGQWYNGSQATTTGSNQWIIFEPLTFRNKAAQAFNVHFSDPGGVPADKVSVLIERLS